MEVRPYVLAAQSFVIGSTNFVLLGLPPGWRALKGPFPPEVDRRVERGDVSWALEGQASFALQGRLGGPETERALLRLQVYPGPLRRERLLARVEEEEGIMLGGHEGLRRVGFVRKGWGPWGGFLAAASFETFCPQTGRTLHILLESGTPQVVAALADALSRYWRCH